MSKLTGNWYTDPMGEFYSWQDYERLYAEQQQSKETYIIQKQNEEERYQKQLADIKNDAINRIADWLVDNKLIQYKTLYQNGKDLLGHSAIFISIDEDVVPIVKEELEQYITTSPNKDCIQLSPSLEDIQKHRQHIGTGVDFKTRKNNPLYINRHIVKSKADDITTKLLKHKPNYNNKRQIKSQKLSQKVINALKDNEKYETIEYNKNAKLVHWGFYFTLKELI